MVLKVREISLRRFLLVLKRARMFYSMLNVLKIRGISPISPIVETEMTGWSFCFCPTVLKSYEHVIGLLAD
jgi:hypothetical protein